AVPPVLVWNSNNSAGHYKRATTSALQLAIANSGGFVARSCSTSCIAQKSTEIKRGASTTSTLVMVMTEIPCSNSYCNETKDLEEQSLAVIESFDDVKI
ncbi:hypothetical protein DH86_00003053, partial [Scytalidium sp. 3C]